MATVFGENGLIYIGTPGATTRVPNINDWEVSIEQEKIEAPRTMFCPSIATDVGGNWVVRTGGFFSATGSITSLYEDTNNTPIKQVLSDQSYIVTIYPHCEKLGYYWIGSAWLQLTHSAAVEEYVELTIDFESTGQWQWVTPI